MYLSILTIEKLVMKLFIRDCN